MSISSLRASMTALVGLATHLPEPQAQLIQSYVGVGDNDEVNTAISRARNEGELTGIIQKYKRVDSPVLHLDNPLFMDPTLLYQALEAFPHIEELHLSQCSQLLDVEVREGKGMRHGSHNRPIPIDLLLDDTRLNTIKTIYVQDINDFNKECSPIWPLTRKGISIRLKEQELKPGVLGKIIQMGIDDGEEQFAMPASHSFIYAVSSESWSEADLRLIYASSQLFEGMVFQEVALEQFLKFPKFDVNRKISAPELGMDPNATLLSYACDRAMIRVVKLLLTRKDLDLDVRTGEGLTLVESIDQRLRANVFPEITVEWQDKIDNLREIRKLLISAASQRCTTEAASMLNRLQIGGGPSS